MNCGLKLELTEQRELAEKYQYLAELAASSSHHADLAHRRLLRELDRLTEQFKARRRVSRAGLRPMTACS